MVTSWCKFRSSLMAVPAGNQVTLAHYSKDGFQRPQGKHLSAQAGRTSVFPKSLPL
jgi:hypothetical protein